MCWGKGEGASSIFRRRSVWLKLLHSIHIKAKSEKHIHNMTTIFYLYDCISFNDLPLFNQPYLDYSPHSGCKLISHIKENKGMVAIMLVLYPSNSPGHTHIGLYLSFTSGVAFPLHHGGIFALKGGAPFRVYHLAGA